MEGLNQRRKKIVAYINQNKEITFNQLKEEFPDISDMTLRTDLKVLDQEKQIVRIHGGAKSIGEITGNDDYFSRRVIANVENKQQIAKSAIGLLNENQTIFIDSGTTTTAFSKIIPDKKFIIYTSGLTCAMELAKLTQPKVCLTGGFINSNSLSVNGSQSLACLHAVNFDVVFMGATRYSAKTGFTCQSLEDAEVKRLVIERAQKVVVLMDSSKLDKNGTYTICSLDKVDVIVSDSNLPEAFIEECQRKGVQVL